MSELRVTSITDEEGTGSPEFPNGVQTKNINGGPIGGRRNLAINGDMKIAQRGLIATNLNSVGYYTADRARTSISMGFGIEFDQEVLQNQIVDSTTVNVLKTTITTAGSSEGGSIGYDQRLEVDDVKHLIGKKVTFSAYIKSDSPTNIRSFSLIDNNTGNFEDVNFASTPIDVTNTWQRITGTTTFGDISSSDYLDLLIRVDATIATSFYITMVQFEAGDIATNFEHRSFGEELLLCQRYFRSDDMRGMTIGNTIPAGTNEFFLSRPIQNMRTAPTCVFPDGQPFDIQRGGFSIDGSTITNLSTKNSINLRFATDTDRTIATYYISSSVRIFSSSEL